VLVRVRKVDKAGGKVYLDLPTVQQVNVQVLQKGAFISLLNFFKEDFALVKKVIAADMKKWARLKIGNIVSCKVKLVQDYGLVLSVD